MAFDLATTAGDTPGCRFPEPHNMLSKLKRSTRRLLALLVLLPASAIVIGTLYMLGMDYLEGNPRTFLQGVQWASETITNTGYGADNRWHHPVMALFVIVTPFIGQLLVFLVFPVLVLPYFEERFEVRLQHVLPPMAGKVLFYHYGPEIESLLEEFVSAQSPFVIFEEDMVLARNLRDRGYDVVFGKLADDPQVLARVDQARAVVTSAGDHANASLTFIVRELGFTGPLYALADDAVYRPPMIQIGATDVFTPAHVLGAALASRASTRISPPAEGMHLLGTKVGMAEFRVRAGSPLAGQRLGELRLRERHGVSVIGQWYGGVFVTTKGPQTRVEPGAIIVVVGAHANLEKVERMALPIRRTGPIVLAGHGAVGHKVVEMLHDAGETCVVIDRVAAPGVDVVGSVLENATLARAGVHEASAVILALSDDSESVFATAVVREYAPEVPLIVRVLRAPNTARLYRSGADFAISVGQVAGQILAYHLLAEQVSRIENRIKFSRLTAGTLAGAHPWRSPALEVTGAKVIAVDRAGDVIVEFDNDFRVGGDDILYVCGSTNSLERYQREFQPTVPAAAPVAVRA
jgi:Trk K+ transport system NAD-binding subunit